MSRNESKTRKDLIDPQLKTAGWFRHDWQIDPEYKITAGSIQFDGQTAKRSRPCYTDYLLRYAPSKPIAVIEAKAEDKHHLEGENQAKNYAKKLGLPFAYCTNGHEIEFFNLRSGTQQKMDRFHTPDELWQMYLKESRIAPKKSLALTYDYYDESGIGQKRQMRYYQEKAVNNAIEAILHGNKRILLTMATGTGKTFTAIQLVYKLWKANIVQKVLFIVDRNILADQAFRDFDSAMDTGACYRLSPQDDQFPLGRDLYFGIYQSLVGVDDEDESKFIGRPDRFKEFPPDYFDLIVIDEAHRGAKRSQDGQELSSWFRLLEYFDSAIQVGLTATPKREESNDTYAHFGQPVVSYSLKDGIQDGFLAPYIIKRVTSNIDALGYRPDSGNIEDVKGQVLEVKDYLTEDFERQLSIPTRTRAFAYHLLRHLFATDPLGKTIVFCLNQNHALDMADYCKEAFAYYKSEYNLKDYNGDYAVRITSNDKDSRGKYPELEKFQDLESYQPIIVTTSKLLTTGVDVKNVKNIVIFRNISSLVEFKQIIGRGTRIYESMDKDRQKLGFFILEYANYSTQLFNDPEWDKGPEDFKEEQPILVDESKKESNLKGLNKKPPLEIFKETNEERLQNIRYRMSEEFLSGRVKMVAESISLTGPDGKPITTETFLAFQSNIMQKHASNIEKLNKIWRDVSERKEFIENTELRLDALKSIFFDKHKICHVDLFDVLASLLFNEKYLTKDERIAKAQKLNPKAFDLSSQFKNKIVKDILKVYANTEYSSLSFENEFWQTALMKRHRGFQGIKNTLDGLAPMQTLIGSLQKALYDERIKVE